MSEIIKTEIVEINGQNCTVEFSLDLEGDRVYLRASTNYHGRNIYGKAPVPEQCVIDNDFFRPEICKDALFALKSMIDHSII